MPHRDDAAREAHEDSVAAGAYADSWARPGHRASKVSGDPRERTVLRALKVSLVRKARRDLRAAVANVRVSPGRRST